MLMGIPQAKASHIMGGDITYNCVGANTFAFTVQLYQDCNGIPLPGSIPLTISSASCGLNFNITLELVPTGPVVVTPLCPGELDVCNGGGGVYGIQQYTYTHIPASQGQGLSDPPVVMPANCTDWVVSWTLCCRNGTIGTGPANNSFYLETGLNNVDAPCNNSPTFLNTPTPYACIGTNVNYSHGASEWDGDSLVFSLIPCLGTGPGVPVNYNAPYSGTNPLASATGVNINAVTGAIAFTPTLAQVAVICVLVEEYRNGVKVGFVMRDIQFTILSCTNSLPLASGAGGDAGSNGATGSYDVTICEGENIDFFVNTFDTLGSGQTTGQNIDMSWNGGVNSPNAAFTVANNNTDSTAGHFTWSTNKGDAGFYIFTVNLQDDACPINGVNIFTFTVTIYDVPDVDAGGYQISCNPTDTITLNAVASGVDSLFQWNALNGGTVFSPTTLVTDILPTSGTYQLIKIYEQGCIDSNVVAVDVSPGLIMPAIPDANLCLGDSIQLDATINLTTIQPTTFSNNTVVPFGQVADTAISTIDVFAIQPGIFSTSMLQSVCLDVAFPFNSFLTLTLTSPNGTILNLSSNNGGANGNYTGTCFTPTAGTNITAGNSPFTGNFSPEDPFSNLNGDVVNGTWILQVSTSTGVPITGNQLNGWSITFVDITDTMSYAWTPTTDLSCTSCPDPWASPTTPTIYQVTSTDFYNCTDTQTVFVDIITALSTPTVTCCQVSTTALTFCWTDITGAVSYEVSIDNGVTWVAANGNLQHQLTGLALGQSVTILVRGIGNCPSVAPSGTQTCTTTPCTLTASLNSSSDATCNGGSDGTVVVAASGGTAPYTFLITGFPSNNTGSFTGLPAASYSIDVTDVNGCLINVPAVINEPTAITFTTDSTLVSCHNGTDGTAIVIATGGTGVLSYQWDVAANNQVTDTATALAAGTYNLTITDANSCAITSSVTVNQPTAIVLDSLTIDVSCNTAMDGSAKVLVQGGIIPYSYAWSANANGQTTDSITALNGGNYSVTVTDNNGCTEIISMYVEEATPIILTTSMAQATCNGFADGSATVAATGGTPATGNTYTYLWDAATNNQTTATATSLNTGTYNVTVTDADGCTAVTSVIVTAPSSMALTTTNVPSTSCSYSTDGTATVTASGGAGGYSYLWSAGTAPTNTSSIAGLSTGTTYVTVTDVNGCSDIDSVSINGPLPVIANPIPTAISCNGADDGTITLTPTGGTGTLSFAWNNGINTQNISNLTAGTFTVIITDANNCTFNDTAIIVEPDTLISTASMTAVSCLSGNDGTATALPIGGQGNYTYNWSSTSTDSIALILTAGTYNLTVTDGANCTDTTSIIVTQPPTAVASTISGTNLFCNGDNSGSVTVLPSGGTPDPLVSYTYQWDDINLSTTATVINLQAGTYNVTVTDGNGCTTTNSVTINEPTLLGGSITGLPTACFGSSDGAVSIAPTGGTAPYTYQWSPTISTDSFIVNVTAGWHLVTVTDNNSCTYIDSFEVLQPIAITTTTTVDSTLCNNNPTGLATVTASGGSGGFTYAWSPSANNQTTATATALPAGTHSVTVTDVNLCTSIATVQVLEPLALATTTTTIAAQCFGAATGAATVSGTGGTLNYTYLWDVNAANATTATAPNLIAGLYFVTLTDANGCSTVDSATVGQPTTGVSTTISGTDLFCNADNSGTVTVLPSGGTSAGYTFIWDDANAQTTATATGLAAGTYTVIVNDGNGCNTSNSVTINEPTPLTGTTAGTPASCFGLADGTAVITPTGGTAPYTYQWSAPSFSVDSAVTALVAGIHFVTVTDNNNCTYIDSFEVIEPIGITTVMTTTPVLCNGGTTGTAAVNATGGNGGFTYLWAPSGDLTSNAANLAAGWHVVTVTDLNGCFTVDSIEVLEPTLLTLTTTQIEVDCYGQATGSATVLPTGGTAIYTYQWDVNAASQISATATNLAAGTYNVTVTDANGCPETISVTINQPATGVEITSIPNTEVSCFAGSDATATVQVTGGAGNYTYNWTPTGQITQTATNLSIGSYTVIVTDMNGCFTIDSVTIDQPAPITTIFTNVVGSSCHQGNDGTATIAASGGVPNGTNGYTYVWNTIPQQQGATATGLTGGQSYAVFVTDANGCTTNNLVVIPQPDPVTLTTTQTNVSCFGFTDATATVIPAGGTPGFTFLWDDNAGNQTNATATGLAFGNYAVTVTDVLGCAAVNGVTITQPAQLKTSESTIEILCKGESTGEAQVLMSGGTAPYYINWQGGLINPPTALAAGIYGYVVTDANGCQLTDSITINEPDSELTAQKETVEVTCFDDRDGIINIYPNGGTAPYQYSLNGTSFDDNQSKVGLTAGDYTFFVKDDKGCTYTETVTIIEPDEFTVDLGNDVGIKLGESVNLEVIPTNGIPNYAYLWTPTENLSCTDCANPIVDSLQDDRYITVMVTDQRGCNAEDDIYIRISKPRYVFIANAFTPNDDGNNDFLFVQGGDGTEKVLSFRVFDRWGELVFEATDGLLNDTNFGWNGKFKNQDLNAGVFVWTAEVQFEDGETLIYKGSTMLIK